MFALSINHHTAPIAIRERLVFQSTEIPDALQHLISHPTIREAVILSTCNRTDIYTDTTQPEPLLQWLSAQKNISEEIVHAHTQLFQDDFAIKHMIRVASGLDSMVLGEPQVFNQMKLAYAIAEKAGTIGEQFRQIFPAIFSSSKSIRTNTDIGVHPLSLANVVASFIKKIFPTMEKKRLLLIGGGEIIALVATYLYDNENVAITIANRTLEHSKKIADQVRAHHIGLNDISTVLEQVDIIITATNAPTPMLNYEMLKKTAPQHPLLLIDLSIPRNIDSAVMQLKHIQLHNMDDFQSIIANNLKNRKAAIAQAEALIDCHFAQLEKKLRIFQTRHVIAQYREHLEKICDTEMEKAIKQLNKGTDPQKVLALFGRQLINKVMHHPTMKLREAASEDHCLALQNIKEFFG